MWMTNLLSNFRFALAKNVLLKRCLFVICAHWDVTVSLQVRFETNKMNYTDSSVNAGSLLF